MLAQCYIFVLRRGYLKFMTDIISVYGVCDFSPLTISLELAASLTLVAQTRQKERLKLYATGAIRRSAPRHFLRDTDVKRYKVVRSLPNVFSNDALASSSDHITNKLCSWSKKVRSWNWKHFFRISDLDRDPNHVQNLMGSSQCHYLSFCQISWKSVH